MKSLSANILLSCLLISTGYAEDLTLLNNRVLKDIHVLDIGVDTLKIQHESGVATVKASDLPLEWQEKYKLTPEEISTRKEEEKKRKDEVWQRQRNALSESEKNPRYLTPSDIIKISNSGGVKMLSLEADVAAAKWNSNEAFRLGDKDMYEYYNNMLRNLQPQITSLTNQKINEEQEKKKKEKSWEIEKAEMELKLAKYETIITGQKKENDRLSDSLSDWEKREKRTIINNWDNGGWGWNRHPDIIVFPSRPSHSPSPPQKHMLNFEVNRKRPVVTPPSTSTQPRPYTQPTVPSNNTNQSPAPRQFLRK